MKLREDILNVRVIEHVYGASWTGKGFVRAPDMADFGPLVKGKGPLADYPPPAGRPKPVRYLPVKKEGNNALFPPVSIELGLSERGRMQSVSVPAWEGASVEIEVANVWDEKNVKTVKLFMITLPVMSGYVYDVFENLKRARQEHFKPLPPDFKLYRLFVSPYDWRLDLTETAKEKVKQLKQIQEGVFCRKAPDTDDQLAVAGHSTGGLIIRRRPRARRGRTSARYSTGFTAASWQEPSTV